VDALCGLGACVLISEIPEMFGAEELLLGRAASVDVATRAAALFQSFRDYFTRHGLPVFENPSPGNRDGGITTLEEKSLGAVQKGGRAPVVDVLEYGEPIGPHPGGGGLAVVASPGNDGVSCTALAAAGASLILFTTGRGTPLGAPVPTIKISSNGALAERKRSWIDFDCGPLLEGTSTRAALAEALYRRTLDFASGERARNELSGNREIAIWKDGVTL
jgi:altronate hydrolase